MHGWRFACATSSFHSKHAYPLSHVSTPIHMLRNNGSPVINYFISSKANKKKPEFCFNKPSILVLIVHILKAKYLMFRILKLKQILNKLEKSDMVTHYGKIKDELNVHDLLY